MQRARAIKIAKLLKTAGYKEVFAHVGVDSIPGEYAIRVGVDGMKAFEKQRLQAKGVNLKGIKITMVPYQHIQLAPTPKFRKVSTWMILQ